MFTFNAQVDPKFRDLPLGPSRLKVGGYGCFIASLATIFQKPLQELLNVPGGVDANGNTNSSVIAAYCQGEALPPTTLPQKGWCIGVTDHFAPQFPTHFVCVNMDTKQQIDPLDFPAKPEPLTYKIKQFRPFKGIKLPNVINPQPVGPFPDVSPDRWSAQYIEAAKFHGWIGGYPDGTFKPEQPMTREEVVALVVRANKV